MKLVKDLKLKSVAATTFLKAFYCSIAILNLFSCTNAEKELSVNEDDSFAKPLKVEIQNYNGNAMEPFISPDGTILFFNNLNSAPENTNLHWAQRVNETKFVYKGEIESANTDSLEGVPTMDKLGNFYFVSIRSYVESLSTIYQAKFAEGKLSEIKLVEGISKKIPGWVNFDVEISRDGQFMYFIDGFFGAGTVPKSADLVLARKTGEVFTRISESESIFQNVNTSDLEFAPSISEDGLELYFTRVKAPITASSIPQIFIARRENSNVPFQSAAKIKSIEGFAEAPSLTPDGKGFYFHKLEKGKMQIYLVKKK